MRPPRDGWPSCCSFSRSCSWCCFSLSFRRFDFVVAVVAGASEDRERERSSHFSCFAAPGDSLLPSLLSPTLLSNFRKRPKRALSRSRSRTAPSPTPTKSTEARCFDFSFARPAAASWEEWGLLAAAAAVVVEMVVPMGCKRLDSLALGLCRSCFAGVSSCDPGVGWRREEGERFMREERVAGVGVADDVVGGFAEEGEFFEEESEVDIVLVRTPPAVARIVLSEVRRRRNVFDSE